MGAQRKGQLILPGGVWDRNYSDSLTIILQPMSFHLHFPTSKIFILVLLASLLLRKSRKMHTRSG